MLKLLTFLCVTSCNCGHCYPGHAYDASYLSAINAPEYGKCRELTDQEIEQVANGKQNGEGYWQVWDVQIPDEDGDIYYPI